MYASKSTGARVVIAEAGERGRSWLEGCLGDDFDVRVLDRGREVLEYVAGLTAGSASSSASGSAAGPAALIIGRRLLDSTPAQLLASLAERAPLLAKAHIIVFVSSASPDDGGWDTSQFPEGLAVHYALDARLAPEHVRTLIGHALEAAEREPEHRMDDWQRAARLKLVLDAARSLASYTDVERLAAAVEHTVVQISGAIRSHCLFHDADTGILWSESEGPRQGEELAASTGLAGFVARVAEPVFAARAVDDPRYVRAIDDPEGTGQESLMVCPVSGPDRVVHAVVVAVSGERPFEEQVREQLVVLAEQVGPIVHGLALGAEADAVLRVAHSEDDAGVLFRSEAVDAYRSRGRQGDVVRVLPPWIHWAYRLLLVLLMIGVVYLIVGRVDEYSLGPAVVRMSGRSDIAAHVSGKVTGLDVVPGQRVARGQVLARLYNADELADFERVREDFRTQLRARMFDPSDAVARQTVSSLRTDMERARARLEERTIRAPGAGAVADVLVQPGQYLNQGDLIASLVADDTELTVVALLPGADRPKLVPGMSLRLELSGYQYAYQDLTIDTVGDDILGPGEARRYLGTRIGDGVAILGPVVIVEARLPAAGFEAHGVTYRFHDGLQGVAEVRTRSRRIVNALIPQLEEL